jgi:hypothetical protein
MARLGISYGPLPWGFQKRPLPTNLRKLDVGATEGDSPLAERQKEPFQRVDEGLFNRIAQTVE